ncbi:MAG: hypothetical protein R3232_08565, partial [Clostridia bacterium]|nr:hypothetical protein [Clostridia bacterium]
MKAVVEEIKTRIAGDLNETMDTSDDAMDKVIEDCVFSHCLENGLGLADIEALYKLAKDEILGFGLL